MVLDIVTCVLLLSRLHSNRPIVVVAFFTSRLPMSYVQFSVYFASI